MAFAPYDPNKNYGAPKTQPQADILAHPGYDPNYQAWSDQTPITPQTSDQIGFSFPKFEMPDFAAIQAGYAAQLRAQQKAAEMAAFRAQRDELYSGRQDAASAAVDYVNQRINEERSNARLLGIDYNINDEQKQARISNYFATLWGEGQEQQLEGLFKKVGKPKGFEEFQIMRGESANSEAGPEDQADQSKGTTGQRRRPALTGQEDEETLGSASILGGA